MDTKKVLLLAGLGGVVAYFLFRRPSVIASNGQVVQGESAVDAFASKAGSFAGAVGTKIGNAVPILRPVANLVGASAAIDTKVNVQQSANIVRGTSSIVHGNVWGGTKQIVTSSAAIAISPVKTAYKLVSSIF